MVPSTTNAEEDSTRSKINAHILEVMKFKYKLFFKYVTHEQANAFGARKKTTFLRKTIQIIDRFTKRIEKNNHFKFVFCVMKNPQYIPALQIFSLLCALVEMRHVIFQVSSFTLMFSQKTVHYSEQPKKL